MVKVAGRSLPALSLLAVVSVTVLSAQVVPGRYIVELDGTPAAHAAERVSRNRRAAYIRDRSARIRSRQRHVRTELARYGAATYESVDIVANALMVQLPDELVTRLRSVPGVVRVYPVYEVRPTLDVALPLHKVPQAWASLGGAESAGVGAKIAIIDTGIDQTHPGFQDPSLAMPDGFPRGNVQSDLAYTSNKVIVARSYLSLFGTESDTSPRDSEGHGTAVGMIAGGVSIPFPGGILSGVAPKAYLGAYNVFRRNGGGTRTDIVLKAFDDAIADGMDVVNLSLGSSFAPRPSDDLFPAIVERATALGVIVVVASGNSGPEPFTIADYAVAPGAISVGATSSSRVFSGSVRLATGQQFLAEPGSGSNRSTPVTAPLRDVAALDQTGLACGSLPSGSLSGRIALILRGTCTFEVKLNNALGAGAAAGLVYTSQDEPERISMSVGSATLPAVMVDYQDGVTIKTQIANVSNLTATIDFQPNPVAVDPNRLATFSGSGPSTDFGIKPDMVATGSVVSAAPGGFVFGSGTSFSSPLVAGATAVLKIARPGYPGQRYRSLLINAATPLVLSSGTPVSVQQAGGGVLNLETSLASTVTAYPTSLSFGTSAGNVSRSLSIFNLGTADETYSISVQSFTGGPAPVVSTTAVAVPARDVRTVAVNLSSQAAVPGRSEGMIWIRGSSGRGDIHVPYWFAISSGTPAILKIVFQEEEGAPGALLRGIRLRVTDASGIPILNPVPTATVVSGGGSIVAVTSADEDYPGLFDVVLRLGPQRGVNVFRVAAGGLSTDVSIEATGL